MSAMPETRPAGTFKRNIRVDICDECGGRRPVLQMFMRSQDGTERDLGTPVTLDCEHRAAAKAEQEALIADRARQQKIDSALSTAKATAEIGARFADRTFANYTVDAGSEQAFGAAQDVAHRMVARGADGDFAGVRGVALYGPYGLGKSHLGAAIVNACLHEGIPAVFATSSKIVESVWSSKTGAARSRFGLAPLLAIDDLGREPANANALRTLLDIVNVRYENRLPCVITSNSAMAQLILERYAPFGDDGAAMLDRLRALCDWPWIALTGKSRRGSEPE